jgi:hypothetical protein
VARRYDATSSSARLGDSLNDLTMQLLHATGIEAYSTRHLLALGYSKTEVNDIEQLEGDIYLPELHVFLECKTSDKHRHSVTAKPRQIKLFEGPHKFYVTSFFDGINHVDLVVHPSKHVKGIAVEKEEGYCVFETHGGEPLQTFMSRMLSRLPGSDTK